ncbi:hypothetical protein FA15DRAFT_692304 [Coprinopsis marcescibilis]|uniref:Uncharacterized protein n=1 Tax=Coprinopsis marcescibilis TaxID=230819 RepID=A0A5C3L3S2_COPMA|nr:hypothetical protein FA15DRAFT_692304 [Coprinopsis marcescibilis]
MAISNQANSSLSLGGRANPYLIEDGDQSNETQLPFPHKTLYRNALPTDFPTAEAPTYQLRVPPIPFNYEEFEKLEAFLDNLTVGDPNVDLSDPDRLQAWGIYRSSADSNRRLCRSLLNDISNLLQRSQTLNTSGDHWDSFDEYFKLRFRIISIVVKIATRQASQETTDLTTDSTKALKSDMERVKRALPAKKREMLAMMKPNITPVPFWLTIPVPKIPKVKTSLKGTTEKISSPGSSVPSQQHQIQSRATAPNPSQRNASEANGQDATRYTGAFEAGTKQVVAQGSRQQDYSGGALSRGNTDTVYQAGPSAQHVVPNLGLQLGNNNSALQRQLDQFMSESNTNGLNATSNGKYQSTGSVLHGQGFHTGSSNHFEREPQSLVTQARPRPGQRDTRVHDTVRQPAIENYRLAQAPSTNVLKRSLHQHSLSDPSKELESQKRTKLTNSSFVDASGNIEVLGFTPKDQQSFVPNISNSKSHHRNGGIQQPYPVKRTSGNNSSSSSTQIRSLSAMNFATSNSLAPSAAPHYVPTPSSEFYFAPASSGSVDQFPRPGRYQSQQLASSSDMTTTQPEGTAMSTLDSPWPSLQTIARSMSDGAWNNPQGMKFPGTLDGAHMYDFECLQDFTNLPEEFWQKPVEPAPVGSYATPESSSDGSSASQAQKAQEVSQTQQSRQGSQGTTPEENGEEGLEAEDDYFDDLFYVQSPSPEPNTRVPDLMPKKGVEATTDSGDLETPSRAPSVPSVTPSAGNSKAISATTTGGSGLPTYADGSGSTSIGTRVPENTVSVGISVATPIGPIPGVKIYADGSIMFSDRAEELTDEQMHWLASKVAARFCALGQKSTLHWASMYNMAVATHSSMADMLFESLCGFDATRNPDLL